MDPQNQKINPDYSFILNKPAPNQPKAGLSKKLIVGVVIAILVLVGLVAATALIPKNYSVQASQTSLAYYHYLGQKQYNQAFALLNTTDASKKATLNNTVGPFLQSSFDLSKCAVQGTIKSGDSYRTTIKCPSSGKGVDQTFVVQTARQNGVMKITSFATRQTKGNQ